MKKTRILRGLTDPAKFFKKSLKKVLTWDKRFHIIMKLSLSGGGTLKTS